MTGAAKTAWTALVVISALWVITHVVVLTAVDSSPLVLGLLLVDVASLVILLVPYRRLAPWAWWAVWIEVAATASVVVWGDDAALAVSYAGLAAVMAVLQVVSRPAFTARRSAGA